MLYDLQDVNTFWIESPEEVETIAKALEEWQQEHGTNEIIQDFLDKLDIIRSSW